MKQNQLKFIYFDVGGVAIIDYSKTNKWNEMLDDLKIPDNLREKFEILFDEHEKKICVGEDINIFVQEAKEKLGINFPENYDMTADFANRFEENPSMIKLFYKLKNDYKIGLLTGQYPNLLNLIFKRGILPSDIWDIIIDSSIEKITKPDPKIYELGQEKAGVLPEEILFVDNKEKALVVPRQMGWKVFEYDPARPEESTKKLEDFIYDK